ncbi:hypothetical protein MRX96_030909 [Rhipicephalus microplus]
MSMHFIWHRPRTRSQLTLAAREIVPEPPPLRQAVVHRRSSSAQRNTKNHTTEFIKQSGKKATPTVDSKREGERQVDPFSATFAVFLVMYPEDILVRHPLGERSQRAVHLRAPTMRLCLVSATISPLIGRVVFAKNCTSASSLACTARRAVDTGGFEKIELCEDGQNSCEDPTSRLVILERFLVPNDKVDVGGKYRDQFSPNEEHHGPDIFSSHTLSPRTASTARDGAFHLLTPFAIALSRWAPHCGPSGSLVLTASTVGTRFTPV